MTYRRALANDGGILAAMNQRLIQDEGHRNPMNPAELEQRMCKWLAGEYRAVIFAEDAHPCGYALFREEPEHIYVRQFFVAEEHRRRGVGRAAFKWLRDHEWKGRRLRVEVLIGNAAGLAFWRSVGFGDYSLTLEKADLADL